MGCERPDKWQYKRLSEICDVINYGYTQSASKDPIGPKFLRITDIQRDWIDWSRVPYCQISESDKDKYILNEGDIVIARTGASTGQNAYISNHPEAVFASYLVRLKINESHNSRYVSYFLRSQFYRDFIEGVIGGSAQPNAGAKTLTLAKLLLPPLPEQQKIASILSAFDDKIELNNQMNRTLEEMASAIFKSWFVDFEPFRDGEFEYNEELEKEIPKGWEVKSVYSLADYINGMAFKQSDFAEEGLPIIKIAELNNGITDNTKLYNGEYKEKYFLRNEDVLFSWSASLGIYLWDGGDAILNQHIFNVKPKGTMTKPILYFLLKEIVNEFIQIAAFRATTMGHIKKTHLQEKKIAIPDDDTMKTINDLLEPVFRQILANKLENHSLAQIRDALLPKLLSGEIRVNLSENYNMFKEAEDVGQ